jgi:site-specific recombinase XerD
MARKMKSPGDVRKLQMMMEHSNLAVTEQYLQFSDEDVKEMTNVGD